jgi:hypothetical protein
MGERWLVGLDLGQSQDPSALAAVEQVYRSGGWAHLCRELRRWPLGTSYVAVVDDLAGLLARPPLAGCTLVVDSTGCGRPVLDMLRSRDLPCLLVPCTITAGAHSSCDQNGWSIGKRELVSVLNVLLGQARLHVAASLPLARTLEGEFANFRAKVTASGHETLEVPWREGQNDDLLFALALAVWYGERRPPAVEQDPLILTQPQGDLFGTDWARAGDGPAFISGRNATGLEDGPGPRTLRDWNDRPRHGY